MHPHLEHVGLLRYRQSLIDQHGGDLLWPDVKPDAQGRRAGRWSKWFNRYLSVAAKVTDPSKVFHSFRHTFKRMARDAGLGEELHDALTGHSGGGGEGRNRARDWREGAGAGDGEDRSAACGKRAYNGHQSSDERMGADWSCADKSPQVGHSGNIHDATAASATAQPRGDP